MASKRCFKCSKVLDLDEFYRHPTMGDGHLGKCKDCTKSDVISNRLKRLDYYRQYDVLRYRNDPIRRAFTQERAAAARKRNPRMARAHQAVAYATRAGKMAVPSACQKCGDNSRKLHAHHEDYGRPLDVLWLCPPCHSMKHRKSR